MAVSNPSNSSSFNFYCPECGTRLASELVPVLLNGTTVYCELCGASFPNQTSNNNISNPKQGPKISSSPLMNNPIDEIVTRFKEQMELQKIKWKERADKWKTKLRSEMQKRGEQWQQRWSEQQASWAAEFERRRNERHQLREAAKIRRKMARAQAKLDRKRMKQERKMREKLQRKGIILPQNAPTLASSLSKINPMHQPRFDIYTGLPIDPNTVNQNTAMPKIIVTPRSELPHRRFDPISGQPVSSETLNNRVIIVPPVSEPNFIPIPSIPIVSAATIEVKNDASTTKESPKENSEPLEEDFLPESPLQIENSEPSEDFREKTFDPHTGMPVIFQQQVFTVLSADGRRLLLDLPINDQERRDLAAACVYLTREQQDHYLSLLTQINQGEQIEIQENIEKINALTLTDEQKEVLIHQLAYLEAKKQQDFIATLKSTENPTAPEAIEEKDERSLDEIIAEAKRHLKKITPSSEKTENAEIAPIPKKRKKLLEE